MPERTFSVEEAEQIVSKVQSKILKIEAQVDALLEQHRKERITIATLKTALVDYYRSQKIAAVEKESK